MSTFTMLKATVSGWIDGFMPFKNSTNVFSVASSVTVSGSLCPLEADYVCFESVLIARILRGVDS